jgi:hypothetical protein
MRHRPHQHCPCQCPGLPARHCHCSKNTSRQPYAGKMLHQPRGHPPLRAHLIYATQYSQDVSYLSEPKAKSRVGGYCCLGNNSSNNPPPLTTPPPFSASATSLKHIVSSMAEAEFGDTFQEATQLCSDSSTAGGIINYNILHKRANATDTRLYWIKDRIAQGQFVVKWVHVDTSMGDYFNKHHSPTHHTHKHP